jgi:tetratricopeptide (TPR) repeat protein/predicted transcriptional regulator
MTEAGLSLLKLVGRRSELLATLVEQPREKRELEDAVSASRSTVDRALKELEEAGLVRWRGGRYHATLGGRLQLQLYREFVERSAAVVDAVDFLGALPADTAIGPGLVEGCTVVEPEALDQYELPQTMAGMLEDTQWVAVALSENMSPESIRKLVRTVNDEGVTAETFLAPELADVLERQFPDILGGLAAGNCIVHEAPVDHFGLMLQPEAGEVAVGADAPDGERLGLLHNDTETAVDWAQEYVHDLRERGTEVTSNARRMARLGGNRDQLLTQGFADLDAVEPREDASLTRGWRTGLSLAEVAAGLAVDRERPTDDGRQSVPAAVFERLTTGTDVAVLGPPGSGKSTTCKTVAWRWHEDDRGPVLYRESGAGQPFSAWPLLAELLRDAEGHALVVVEDAVRPEANDVFRVMAEFTGEDDVTVLLDAREHEWHDPPSFPADGRLETYRVEAVETVTMPPVDGREVERFAERFEAATDATLGIDPEQLLSTIREATDEAAGPATLQLLLHRLSLRAAPLVAEEYRTPTTLVEDVRRAITTVQPLDEPGLAVAALANLLNAAGMTPDPSYLHAVGAATGDHEAVEEAIDLLEGRVLFPETDGWRMVHEAWSALFLDTLRSELAGDHAEQLVGGALSALLALADDPDRRATVEAALQRSDLDADATPLDRIEEDPTEWTVETVERLFRTPLEYPGLTPLFGSTDGDAVELPATLPDTHRASVARWRARAYREGGFLDRGAEEYEALRERAEEWTPDRADRLEARAVSGLGTVAYRRGEMEAAEERYREALAAAEKRGDPERAAANRKHLGNVAWVRGDLEAAEEYYRESLSTFREVEDPLGAAYVRHNLGNVVDAGGDPAAAEEHYHAALSTYRELGKRGAEADCLNNLGVLAESRGDLAAAAGHYRDCLERYGELGDRIGQANALANLGLIADKRADPDDAERYASRALQRYRTVGDSGGEAFALTVLAGGARQRGDVDAAGDHLTESRQLYEDVGDRQGQTNVDCRRARLARDRGDLDAAAEAATAARETAAEVGDDGFRAVAEVVHGDVARRRGEHEAAADHFAAAREAYVAADAPLGEAVAHAGRAELALADDDPGAALAAVRTGLDALAGDDLEDGDAGALLADRCERAGHLDALAGPLRAALGRTDAPLDERLDDLERRLRRR